MRAFANTNSHATNDLTLADDEIHLWQGCRDLSGASLAEAASWLSADEQIRAGRFRFEQDQNRFRAGRGLLRKTLASYLESEPAQVHFSYTQQGKPFLTNQSEEGVIHFNVSHSERNAVFAVTRGEGIGVDIEAIQEEIDCNSLAAFCFAPPELAEWESLPVSQRQEAFFGFWTRKEAYLKAIGTGLLCPLQEFAVSLKDTSVTLLTPEGKPCGVSPFRVAPFDCGAGYIGAFAASRVNGRLRYFNL